MNDADPPPVTLELALRAVSDVLPARRRPRVALGPDTRFEDLGMSSLDVAEVFVRLEELVGRPLDASEVESTHTIGDLLALRPGDEERAW